MLDGKAQGEIATWRKCLQQRPRLFYGVLLTLILTFLYALLQNGYWAVGNDNTVYLLSARNLLRGDGLTCAGGVVRYYPPAWPLALASQMKVSASFWFLNGVGKLLMISGALLYYALLCRMTTPGKAFVCVLLAATLWRWMRASYVLGSECLFIPLLAGSLLVAHGLSRGQNKWPRLLLLPLLGAALVATRWAGLVAVVPVALTAISGEIRPRMNRKWVCCAMLCLVAILVFGLLYFYPPFAPEQGAVQASLEARTSGKPSIAPTAFIGLAASRLPLLGVWICNLLWMPDAITRSAGTLLLVCTLIGWVLLYFLGVTLKDELKRRRWLWLGVIVYLLVLGVRWTPNGRYLLPFAPLIILAVLSGMNSCRWLSESPLRVSRKWGKVASLALVGVIGLWNICIFIPTVLVQQSDDFYGKYRAGEWGELLDAVAYIREHTPESCTVAVSTTYQHMGRPKESQIALMIVRDIAGRRAVPIGMWPHTDGLIAQQVEALRNQGFDYLLCRPSTSPSQIWHFRVAWLQRMATGAEETPQHPFWELYEIRSSGIHRINIPKPTVQVRAIP